MAIYSVNRSSEKFKQASPIRVTGIVVGLTAVAFMAANVGLITPGVTGSPSPATVAAKGGGTGGGSAVTVTLPANFPASVPVPSTGTLIGTNTSNPGGWVLQYRLNLSYADAMQLVDTMYLSSGFTKPGDVAVYESPAYNVSVVGANVDHSATRTDITIGVTSK